MERLVIKGASTATVRLPHSIYSNMCCSMHGHREHQVPAAAHAGAIAVMRRLSCGLASIASRILTGIANFCSLLVAHWSAIERTFFRLAVCSSCGSCCCSDLTSCFRRRRPTRQVSIQHAQLGVSTVRYSPVLLLGGRWRSRISPVLWDRPLSSAAFPFRLGAPARRNAAMFS